jgi:hypothetical protein
MNPEETLLYSKVKPTVAVLNIGKQELNCLVHVPVSYRNRYNPGLLPAHALLIGLARSGGACYQEEVMHR